MFVIVQYQHKGLTIETNCEIIICGAKFCLNGVIFIMSSVTFQSKNNIFHYLSDFNGDMMRENVCYFWIQHLKNVAIKLKYLIKQACII